MIQKNLDHLLPTLQQCQVQRCVSVDVLVVYGHHHVFEDPIYNQIPITSLVECRRQVQRRPAFFVPFPETRGAELDGFVQEAGEVVIHGREVQRLPRRSHFLGTFLHHLLIVCYSHLLFSFSFPFFVAYSTSIMPISI